jgi:hypothetical protein
VPIHHVDMEPLDGRLNEGDVSTERGEVGRQN